MSKAEREPAPLEDVDPLLAEYASAVRDVDMPSPERAEVVWAEVEANTRSRSRLWIPIVVAVAAVILGVVLVAPSSVMQRAQDGRPKQTPYRSDGSATQGQAESRPEPSTTAPKRDDKPIPQPVAEPEPQHLAEPKPASPQPPKRTKPSNETGPAKPSSLAQETSLLRDIQRAQAAKLHRRVLELTRTHSDRFQTGTFSAESSLARVRALCALGRTTDARKASQDFIRNHPSSHLVPQFESACPL